MLKIRGENLFPKSISEKMQFEAESWQEELVSLFPSAVEKFNIKEITRLANLVHQYDRYISNIGFILLNTRCQTLLVPQFQQQCTMR